MGKNQEILDKYMKDPSGYLDRHKVAAIAIASVIHTELISLDFDPDPDVQVWFGLQRFAIEIGLNYMLNRTNDILKGKSDPASGKCYVLDAYEMPELLSCDKDREYIETFARLLYRIPPQTPEAILDVSNRLFLVEYIALLNAKIDPSILTISP